MSGIIPSSVRHRAELALEQLRAEGAPQRVINCGQLALDCYVSGVSPPAYAWHVLKDHASRRMAQNRYGQ